MWVTELVSVVLVPSVHFTAVGVAALYAVIRTRCFRFSKLVVKMLDENDMQFHTDIFTVHTSLCIAFGFSHMRILMNSILLDLLKKFHGSLLLLTQENFCLTKCQWELNTFIFFFCYIAQAVLKCKRECAGVFILGHFHLL
jgi:hypothetical protein